MSHDAKGRRRDHAQVLANGGVAAAAALLGPTAPGLALWIVTGSLAAAAADTWATSVGTWSRVTPRLILGGRPVPAGTSGGVTVAGCAGAAAGALLVAGAGALGGGDAALLPAAALIGFLGMAADAVLGAALQGRFQCTVCRVATEWPVHRCGAATTHQGGLAWLDNDRVNFAATLGAGLLAALAWRWLHA